MNQTKSFLPAELYFSMGRLAAISSLLFIVMVVLIIMFLIIFKQRNASHYDEYELESETDPTLLESKTIELSNFKQYASTDNNQKQLTTTSVSSFQSDIDEQNTRSITNLVSSK